MALQTLGRRLAWAAVATWMVSLGLLQCSGPSPSRPADADASGESDAAGHGDAGLAAADAASMDAASADATLDATTIILHPPPPDDAGSADSVACDPNGDPKVQQDLGCPLDPALAVHVSVNGSDVSGDGSAAKPFATVAHAVAARGTRTRVYLCGGSYREQVALTAATGAASLFGGFDCSQPTWTWTGATTTITSPVADYVLSVSGLGLASSIAIEDLTLVAPDASGAAPVPPGTGAGRSSIGAIAWSSAVTFTRVTISAGSGAPGADGIGTADQTFSPIPTGKDAGTINVCKDGSSTGGAAGIRGTEGQPGTSDPPIAEPTEPGRTGAGSSHTGALDSGCTPPAPGSDAPAPPKAATGTVFGTVSSDYAAWLPGTGAPGATGSPAQGGGGACCVYYLNANSCYSGGAGGPGGCGGAGAGGGSGGGASAAILSVDAHVTLVACTLKTSLGGRGGRGGSAQGGQAGAPGGPALFVLGTYVTSAGATGGNGAGGAGGGGGPAGLSVGILYSGTTQQTSPTIDSATQFAQPSDPTSCAIDAGAGCYGLGGLGGAAVDGSTNPGPDGPPGYPAGQAIHAIFTVLGPPWDGTR